MSIDKKTIGPMTLSCDSWRLSGEYFFCRDVMRQHFNIPADATQLWVTLTKRRPSHGDAIHVTLVPRGPRHHPYCTLDDETDLTELARLAYRLLAAFGKAFYATIHYA